MPKQRASVTALDSSPEPPIPDDLQRGRSRLPKYLPPITSILEREPFEVPFSSSGEPDKVSIDETYANTSESPHLNITLYKRHHSVPWHFDQPVCDFDFCNCYICWPAHYNDPDYRRGTALCKKCK